MEAGRAGLESWKTREENQPNLGSSPDVYETALSIKIGLWPVLLAGSLALV